MQVPLLFCRSSSTSESLRDFGQQHREATTIALNPFLQCDSNQATALPSASWRAGCLAASNV